MLTAKDIQIGQRITTGLWLENAKTIKITLSLPERLFESWNATTKS